MNYLSKLSDISHFNVWAAFFSSSPEDWFFFRISAGSGIFLASLVIALVLLYGQTKDRWNWAKPVIVPCTLIRTWGSQIKSRFTAIKSKWVKRAIIVLLVGLTTAVIFLANPFRAKHVASFEPAKETIVKSLPSTWKLGGIYLGMKEEDLLVERGRPEFIDPLSKYGMTPSELEELKGLKYGWPQRRGWLAGTVVFRYDPEDSEIWTLPGEEFFDAKERMTSYAWLKDKVVVAIQIHPLSLEKAIWDQWGMGEFGAPSNKDELVTKFGEPTSIDTNETARTYFWANQGVFCAISKGVPQRLGIYSPEALKVTAKPITN